MRPGSLVALYTTVFAALTAWLLIEPTSVFTGSRKDEPAAVIWLAGGQPLAQGEYSYVFFSNGRARSRICLPEHPEVEEREAGALLQEVFRDMGRVETLLLTNCAEPSEELEIHVGKTQWARSVVRFPDNFDADGFAILPYDARRLVLLGARSVSTFYAVTEFLECYAGVLWVWPGEYGTVIPRVQGFEATVRELISEPAFRSRRFSGIGEAKLAYFRIHQTARETRSSFGQHVLRVLTPELYKKHPDYFSLVAGERRWPTPDRRNWQACTTNPAVVALFVQAAREQFQRQPWVDSFSVSQNDGHGFCECERCRTLDIPGVSGFSDRYFTFVNAVADGIRERHPEKLISSLAYGTHWTAGVPQNIELRPNTLIYTVVPTLRDPLLSIQEWSQAAPNLGAYFWLHGKPVPKLYPHRWAEYLRFLRRHGVSGVHAEIYQQHPEYLASWHLDGPRVWITAKLLWDPDADIDDLLDRFCTRFYGPAAPPMRRYYRNLLDVWERKSSPFDFGNQYRDPEFGLYSTEDMNAMERCIQDALVLAAGSPEPTARLQALAAALAPVAEYIRRLALADAFAQFSIQSDHDAEAAVARVHAVETLRRQRKQHGHPLWATLPDQTEQAIDALFGRISLHLASRAPEFWQKILRARPALACYVIPQLQEKAEKGGNLAMNPSFEITGSDPSDKDTPPNMQAGTFNAQAWRPWIRTGASGTVAVVEGIARTGNRSLQVSGAGAACAVYIHPVAEGERYRVSCWARSAVPFRAGEDAQPGYLRVRWQSATGRWLKQYDFLRNNTVHLRSGTGDWQHLGIAVSAPPLAARMLILLCNEGQRPADTTWFDDVYIQPCCVNGVQTTASGRHRDDFLPANLER